MQSPAVTIGKIAQFEKTAPLAGGIGAGGNAMFANPIMQVANEVVGKPVATATGKALQTGGRAMQMAANGGGVPDIVKYGAGAAGGAGILSMLTGGGGGGQQQMDPMLLAGMGGEDDQSGMVQYEDGSFGMPQDNEPTVAGYTRADLEGAYVAALMDENAEAAEAIGTMIDMLDNTEKRTADSKKDKSGNEKAANAARAMSNLMAVYEQGGGAQGPVGALGSLLNKATFGTMNPSQAAYEDMLQAAAVAVARANGEVGVLSNQDIENYRKMLPTFADNPQQAQIKLQTIMSGLQSME